MSRPAHEAPHEALTERELVILRLLADGMSNRDIAERLWLSVNTVKWHTQRLFDKLHVRRRTQAIAAGRTLALLEGDTRSGSRAERSRLPAQASSFIGRERELGEVRALLRRSQVRLATLTGPAGAGKTRLSLQAAVDLLDEYEHGVHFVALAPITDPDLVLPTIASALKVKEIPGQTLLASLSEYLHDKAMLLVLDNFEQVVQAAPAISELLSAAPRLKIMVSSRERLRVSGEHDYPVPPLGLPQPGSAPTVEALSQYEAVALFIQRAQAANPGFEITAENAPAVAEICIRLDGLPLAIELAAARSRLLTPQALLDRLSSRLKALTGGPRDLPARQQTLRSAIDWSYDLLDAGEKTLFARLGVFAGVWTLEAAEAVCGAGLPFEVVDGLASLLDKSLIRQYEDAARDLSFAMLQTIHEYAAERLAASGEQADIGHRHAVYYRSFAEAAREYYYTEQQPIWRQHIKREGDNVRAAARWSLEHNQPDLVVEIGHGLLLWWSSFGQVIEPYSWFEDALRQDSISPHARARGLRVLGALAAHQGNHIMARSATEESLALARSIGDSFCAAACLNNLGNHASRAGRYAEAQRLYEESRALFQALGDTLNSDRMLFNLAQMALVQGHLGVAETYLDEYRQFARAIQTPSITMGVLSLESRLAALRGEFDAARAAAETVPALSGTAGKPGVLQATDLGFIALREGHYREARAHLRQALGVRYEENRTQDFILTLLYLAEAEAGAGGAERAARLFGAVEAWLERIDMVIFPIDTAPHQQAVETVRAQMDPAVFAAAWAEGRAMSLAHVAEYALPEQ